MILIAISYHGRKGKNGEPGTKPLEKFFDQAFSNLGKWPSWKERALQKKAL